MKDPIESINMNISQVSKVRSEKELLVPKEILILLLIIV
jgi:hypothetical protein